MVWGIMTGVIMSQAWVPALWLWMCLWVQRFSQGLWVQRFSQRLQEGEPQGRVLGFPSHSMVRRPAAIGINY